MEIRLYFVLEDVTLGALPKLEALTHWLLGVIHLATDPIYIRHRFVITYNITLKFFLSGK